MGGGGGCCSCCFKFEWLCELELLVGLFDFSMNVFGGEDGGGNGGG